MKFAAYSRPATPEPNENEPISRRRSTTATFTSPKPNTFGLSRRINYRTDGIDTSDNESSDSDSLSYESDSQPAPPPKATPQRVNRTPAEQREVDEAMAAIRLRTRHQDPVEEWERKTRKDCFREAHRQARTNNAALMALQMNAARLTNEKIAKTHAQQLEEVQAVLSSLAVAQRREEEQLYARMAERDKSLRASIELVIAKEEAKARAEREKAEAAAKKAREEKEAQERKQREEEERRAKEAEEKRLKEELEKKKKEQEEAERKAAAERAAKEQAEAKKYAQERDQLGFTTALEDWKGAREILAKLKANLKDVKSSPDKKREWSKIRRQMTAKIGQITNSESEIARITSEIKAFVQPTLSSPTMYTSVLSSLAKAILLQAETEVTAKKDTAAPLAKVVVNLLVSLEGFPEALWAKYVQRAGGWAIAYYVPREEGQNDDDYLKMIGRKQTESSGDYSIRLSGLVSIYFAILVCPSNTPLPHPFRPTRLWVYVTRLLRDTQLLASPLAPSVLVPALEIGGESGMRYWGKQWYKILSLIGEGANKGDDIGGSAVEGKAGRVRLALIVENLIKSFAQRGTIGMFS